MYMSDYTLTKADLNTQLNSSFAIPSDLISELEEYRLVYWNASHLYKMLRIYQDSKKYYIERQDTMYSVVMQNCSIDQIYDIATNEPDRQIRISFRQARKHWNLDPVAIIKLPASRAKIIDLRDSKGNYNHA